ASTPLPILTKVKLRRRIDRGQQLKGVEFLSANVYLLEDETDRFAAIFLVEPDDRHLVVLDVVNNALEELGLKIKSVGLTILPVAAPCEIPVGMVEDLIKREEILFVLRRGGRQIKHNVPAEVGLDDAVLGDAYYGFLDVGGV